MGEWIELFYEKQKKNDENDSFAGKPGPEGGDFGREGLKIQKRERKRGVIVNTRDVAGHTFLGSQQRGGRKGPWSVNENETGAILPI